MSGHLSNEGKATDPEGTNATGSPSGIRDWLGKLFGVVVLVIVSVGPPLGSWLATDHLEPYEHVGWVWRSLGAAVLAVPFAMLGLRLVVRWVHNENIRALAAIYVVMYALPATLMGLSSANVLLDLGPGVPRNATVIEVERRHKGQDRVRLEWSDEGAKERFRVTYGIATGKAGSAVCFRHFPGAMGWDWVRRLPDSDCARR